MKVAIIPLKNKLGVDQDFKISRFKEKIKKTKPHKHDGYCELIYLTQGEGYHWIEASKFKIAAPELYFMQAGQLHCWQFTTVPKGFVILIKEAFFDSLQDRSILQLVKALNELVRIPLDHAGSIGFIFEDLMAEFQAADDLSEEIIKGYLRVLFSKILQRSSAEPKNQNLNALYNRFLKMISDRCPELRNVNDFAQQLNTTRQHLNAVCRQQSGKSASEHITDHLLLEAKRYILHSESSINEIAHLLHFSDPSYFIRFFKRHESVTPLQFRRQHFQ